MRGSGGNVFKSKYFSWKYSRFIDKYEHPKMSYDGDVFLGNIPWDFTMSKCLNLLSTFGRVSEIRLINGKMRFNINKGYAFVKFYSPLEAEEAVIHLDQMEVGEGVHLRAILCRTQRRIVVDNIPMDKTQEEIFETLSSRFRLIKNVKSMKPLKRKDGIGEQLNIGFAFVEFQTHGSAVKALRLMNAGGFKFWGRSLNATWMAPDKLCKRAIVTNVPCTISDQLLFDWLQCVSMDGVIEFEWYDRHVQLEFRTNYQAELAIRNMNRIPVEGCVLKMHWDVLGK